MSCAKTCESKMENVQVNFHLYFHFVAKTTSPDINFPILLPTLKGIDKIAWPGFHIAISDGSNAKKRLYKCCDVVSFLCKHLQRF